MNRIFGYVAAVMLGVVLGLTLILFSSTSNAKISVKTKAPEPNEEKTQVVALIGYFHEVETNKEVVMLTACGTIIAISADQDDLIHNQAAIEKLAIEKLATEQIEKACAEFNQ